MFILQFILLFPQICVAYSADGSESCVTPYLVEKNALGSVREHLDYLYLFISEGASESTAYEGVYERFLFMNACVDYIEKPILSDLRDLNLKLFVAQSVEEKRFLLTEINNRKKELLPVRALKQEIVTVAIWLAPLFYEKGYVFEGYNILFQVKRLCEADKKLHYPDGYEHVWDDIVGLMGHMMHDMKTPINALAGFQGIIRELETFSRFSIGDAYVQYDELMQNFYSVSSAVMSEAKMLSIDGFIDDLGKFNAERVMSKTEHFMEILKLLPELKMWVEHIPLDFFKDRSSAKECKEILLNSLNKLIRIVTVGFSAYVEQLGYDLFELKPYVDFKEYFPTSDIREFLLDQRGALNGGYGHVKVDSQVSRAAITPDNLNFIMYNLVSNAIKYGGDNLSDISVHVSYENNMVVLRISNDGNLIEDKYLEFSGGRRKLFWKGVSAGYVSDERGSSHGIGLDTVYRLVLGSGGAIDVDNVEKVYGSSGKKSVRVEFEICLPPFFEESSGRDEYQGEEEILLSA